MATIIGSPSSLRRSKRNEGQLTSPQEVTKKRMATVIISEGDDAQQVRQHPLEFGPFIWPKVWLQHLEEVEIIGEEIGDDEYEDVYRQICYKADRGYITGYIKSKFLAPHTSPGNTY